MPVNNFSVGTDVSLNINTPSGPLNVQVTDFTADPVFNELKSKPLSGVPIFGYIPDGWKGMFRLDRNGPNVDNFFAAAEAAYYAGQNLPAGSILQTIREADGSITQWRYTGVVLKFDKAGDWNADKKVEQEIGFMAGRRIKVA
jgi:hypothetical protein